MTERPAGNTLLPEPQEEITTWEQVAEQAPGWHAGLHPHVNRLLAKHGIDAVVDTETAPADEAGKAAAERVVTPAEIAQAFEHNRTGVRRLGASDDFAVRCAAKGVDPTGDMDKPKYWKVYAEYARGRQTAMREYLAREAAGRQEKPRENLHLRTWELMTAAPEYLFEEYMMNSGRTHESEADRKHGKNVVSGFNRLVRAFARDFPETRTEMLETALLNVALSMVENDGVLEAAPDLLKSCMKGARHELGFGQLLRAAGRKYKEGTREQDQAGIDYEDTTNPNATLYLDVKASLAEVDPSASPEEPFKMRPDGKIVIYSLLLDREFKGRFFVPEHIVRERAAKLNEILYRARTSTSVRVG